MIPAVMSMVLAVTAQVVPARGSVTVPAQAARPAATYPYRLIEPSAAALAARAVPALSV